MSLAALPVSIKTNLFPERFSLAELYSISAYTEHPTQCKVFSHSVTL